MELKSGDVAMLKSGDHPMTVAEVNGDSVVCVWMGDEGDLFRETLPLAVLELALLASDEVNATFLVVRLVALQFRSRSAYH